MKKSISTRTILIVLGLLQLVMLIVVFSPLLDESDSYKTARGMLLVNAAQNAADSSESQETLDIWADEVFRRDLQVYTGSTLLAALFINSFVLCALIDKTLGGTSQTEGLKPRRRKWDLLDKPLVIVAMGLGLTMVISGSVGLGMAYKNPSPLGLWSLVSVIVGATIIIVTFICAMASRSEPSNL